MGCVMMVGTKGCSLAQVAESMVAEATLGPAVGGCMKKDGTKL